MRNTTLLVPPYHDTCSPVPGGPPPPLGAIAYCDLHGAECPSRLAASLRTRAPWIPVVLVGDHHALRAAWTAIPGDEAMPCLIATLHTPLPREKLPHAVLQAVNARPTPPPLLFARWLARRLHQPAVQPLIARALRRAYGTNKTARTLQWQVQRELHCHPSDLRRLVRLAIQPSLFPTIAALAAGAGTTITRLRERVRRGLGISLTAYNVTPGWEWVLEAAVRRGLGSGEWGVGSGEWPKVAD